MIYTHSFQREGCILHAEAISIAGLEECVAALQDYIDTLKQDESEKDAAAKALISALYPGEKLANHGAIKRDYGVDDIVKLTPRTGDADAIRKLQKYGTWWKVKHAARGKAGPGTAWLLQSIREQPREIKTAVIEFVIQKQADELFAVIGVHQFPAAFVYKMAEIQLRIDKP